VNNYWKSAEKFFPFDDTTLAETNRSFMEACKTAGGPLSVWKMPTHQGPWQGIDLIGFRGRRAIELDLKIANQVLAESTNKAEKTTYSDEVMQLNAELAARDVAAHSFAQVDNCS
jgi:hypothetical protein